MLNASLPMSELKSLMQTIATEVFDTKKVELSEEIEDECEYKVYIQSVEIEQTFENFEEQLKSRAETMDFKKIVQEQCAKTMTAELKSAKDERTGHGIGVNLPIYPWAKIQRYPDKSLIVTGEKQTVWLYQKSP